MHGDYCSIDNFPLKMSVIFPSDVWNVLRYFKNCIDSFIDFWRNPRAVRKPGWETLIYSF